MRTSCHYISIPLSNIIFVPKCEPAACLRIEGVTFPLVCPLTQSRILYTEVHFNERFEIPKKNIATSQLMFLRVAPLLGPCGIDLRFLTLLARLVLPGFPQFVRVLYYLLPRRLSCVPEILSLPLFLYPGHYLYYHYY